MLFEFLSHIQASNREINLVDTDSAKGFFFFPLSSLWLQPTEPYSQGTSKINSAEKRGNVLQT